MESQLSSFLSPLQTVDVEASREREERGAGTVGPVAGKRKREESWLPDGYSQILRSYVFGPSGFWTMAPLLMLSTV